MKKREFVFGARAWKRVIVGVVACLALATASAYAAGTCDAILSQAMYNIRVSKGSEATVVTKYFNHCQNDLKTLSEAEFDRAELEIFGYGKGGGGITKERRIEEMTQWCETNAETASNNFALLEESRLIYADSVRAWDKCNQLFSSAIQLDPDLSTDRKTVQFSLRYLGGSRSGVTLQRPLVEGFSCSVRDQVGQSVTFEPGALPEITNEAISIACRRKGNQVVTRDGTTYTVVPRGAIGIVTGQEHVLLSFVEEWSPPLPADIAARLAAALEDEVQSRKDADAAAEGRSMTLLDDLKTRLATTTSGDATAIRSDFGGGWAYCPAGYYLAGLRTHDDDGGGYCVGCVTGVSALCRRLPSR
jgi:hypothetical protein